MGTRLRWAGIALGLVLTSAGCESLSTVPYTSSGTPSIVVAQDSEPLSQYELAQSLPGVIAEWRRGDVPTTGIKSVPDDGPYVRTKTDADCDASLNELLDGRRFAYSWARTVYRPRWQEGPQLAVRIESFTLPSEEVEQLIAAKVESDTCSAAEVSPVTRTRPQVADFSMWVHTFDDAAGFVYGVNGNTYVHASCEFHLIDDCVATVGAILSSTRRR